MVVQKVLVTGGAGYIGSHTVLELLKRCYDVVIFDNFSNSSPAVIDRILQINSKSVQASGNLYVIEGDIKNLYNLRSVFSTHDIDLVIHFAGLKSVSESVNEALNYYHNNVSGSLNLFEAMSEAGVFKLIFSSSATVYQDGGNTALNELSATGMLTNPYGRSKLMIEDVLRDLCISNEQWSIAVLRYFNPIGAHESGLIGEHPLGIPNNLIPYVNQVASGQREFLTIFGDDYNTKDGTGVRDYIHVSDLSVGHLSAMQWTEENAGFGVWNLGTGKPYSVSEVLASYEKISSRKIPIKIGPRRAGDLASCYADPSRARHELNWVAKYDIDRMLADAWRWHSQNPNGYDS